MSVVVFLFCSRHFYRPQVPANDRSQYKDPDDVADATLHALFDDHPKLRYIVVPNREQAGLTIGRAVQRVTQLNEGQEYSFSRDELIEMLDEARGADEE